MKSVPLRHIQHHLSELIREVDQGNELLITRRLLVRRFAAHQSHEAP